MVTLELALTLFTFTYIIVETTIFIKEHMKLGIEKVTNEKQVLV